MPTLRSLAPTVVLRHSLAFAIAGFTLVHLALGFVLDFSTDEAHYALYARFLDWSYFDHPPLVGWIQWPLIRSDAPEGIVRLIPQVLWLTSLALVASIARTLGADGLGISWSVTAWLLAPLPQALAVGLVPDSLLVVFTLLSMRLALALADHWAAPGTAQHSPWQLWLSLGLCVGLAGLSKYTAILAAFALALCLFAWRGHKLVSERGLWVALLVAALAVAPVFIWNLQHDWISFTYQLRHGVGAEPRWSRIVTFMLVQLLVFGPLIAIGTTVALRAGGMHRPALLWFFAIPFVVFAWMSRGGGSLPHWTAPAWAALAPLSGLGLSIAWRSGQRLLIAIVAAAQCVVCLCGFVLLFNGGIPLRGLDDPGGRDNPVADLYGWRAAANHARCLSDETHTPYLAVQNWTLASVLAWYARPLPVMVLDDRFDQFDLWFGQLPVGADAVVVGWSGMKFAPPVHPGEFASCERRGSEDVVRAGRIIGRTEFLLCRHWGGHPAPERSAQ